MKHGILFLALLILLIPAAAGAQDRRIALVIGNGEYVDVGRLTNPPNDAADIAEALKAQGFEVTLLIDASRKAMNQGLNTFYDQLAADPSSAGVFWYAGHGIQAKDENYLIPVGADIQREADLEDEAVSVRKVMSLLDDARNRLNLVVLDACRNNPFPAAGRSGTRGLKVVTSAPAESIIMYSTGAGQVANDGTGRNSPFAQAFLKYLGQPGDIMTTVKAVTAETKRLTGGRGANVVLDMVAGDYVAREVECLADDGRLAIIAVQGGTKSSFDVGLVLRKRLAITGSTLRPRTLAYKAQLAKDLAHTVWPLVAAGRIRPVIHQVFAAERAAEAHALMESSAHVGKLVLSW